MTETVIAALIPAVCSFAATLIGILASSKLTTYRIGELEKKVSKHNNLVERMIIVEQSTKSAHKRIDAITGNSERDRE